MSRDTKMSEKFLPPGKLQPDLLEEVLRRCKTDDKRVIVGPAVGEDAAVIDFDSGFLVVKTDPITFLSEDCGSYVVNINANDIAAMGAVPKWFLASVLLPEGKVTGQDVLKLVDDVRSSCDELGISLCGGHTEVTSGIDRTIIVGQMLGEVTKDKLVLSSGAKRGDIVLLTKGIAVEGTSVIARKKEKYLLNKYSRASVKRMQEFIRNPGISVVKEALLANSLPGIHAMHDPTEGGLSTGLYELAKASDKRLEVYENEIPVLSDTAAMCREFKLDPFGLIASGALLIVVEADSVERVVKLLQGSRINVTIIGKVVNGKGVCLIKKGKKREMPFYAQDEITRVS